MLKLNAKARQVPGFRAYPKIVGIVSKHVPEGSGYVQAGSSTGLQTLATGEIEVVKSGYLTVFVSNQSSSYKAYFDNLSIEHRTGPLLAEDDYYPFGLTMAGISSKAANKLDNKKKYNGIEYNNDFDLDTYEAFYRNLDPQIGRWWQIDPKIESMEAWSPYASNYDNPIRYSDFLGDDPIPGAGFWRNVWEGVKDGGKSTVGFVKSLGTVEGWKGVGKGVVDLSERMSPASIEGWKKNAQTARAIVNYVSNVPNMTKDQIGHDIGFGTEKIVETVAISKGTGMVTKVIEGANSTTLFRAASAAEVTDMASNGVRNISTGYETGKLFATSAQDAAQFGKNNFGLDGIPNTITKVRVPNSVMKTATTFEADGMKAVSISANQLPKVTPLKPLNYSPKPTNPYGGLGW